MSGSGWWIYGVFLFLAIADHYWLVWRRNQIQDSIQQSIEYGHIEIWVRGTVNRYRGTLFAHRRDFRAELIVTEKAIYVFRVTKIFGRLKVYHYLQIIFVSSQDVPKIANRIGLPFADRTFLKVDSVHINGRQINLLFSDLVRSFGKLRRIRQFHYEFSNVRDNDTYRNFLLFQRRHQQITKQQQMHRSIIKH